METNKRSSHPVWEIIKFLFITAIVVLPFRAYIAQPFIVSGASMSPNLVDREYLIVDELTYNLGHQPERGDVVVFKYPQDTSKFFIKRVIGLPGETVRITEGNVYVLKPNDKVFTKLNESYLPAGDVTRDNLEMKLAGNEYFVMGDNRPVSFDSRSWGPLPAENITGRALARLFPFNKITLFPGAIK